MRRLLLVILVLGVAGLLVYRNRSIDQWEERLGIGRHAGSGSDSA
jgi:hypothetical protein